MDKINPLKKRSMFLDIAKIITVLLMVTTHFIIFFNLPDNEKSIGRILGDLGGIACFTTFLYLFGLGSAFSLSKNLSYKQYIKKFLKVLEILIQYFLISILYLFLFVNQKNNPLTGIFSQITEVLTLQKITEFSEYLIAFVLIITIFIIFRKFFKLLSNNLLATLFVGILFYFIGSYFSAMPVSSPVLNTIKVLLFGSSNETSHSFPLFQYLIFLLLGLYLGKKIILSRKKILLNFFVLAITITIFAVVSIAGKQEVNNLSIIRFPPSVLFLVLSFIFSNLIVLSSLLIERAFFNNISGMFTKKTSKIINHLGNNTLYYVFWHLLLLYILTFLKNQYNFDLFSGTLINFGLLFVAVILLTFIIPVFLSFFLRITLFKTKITTTITLNSLVVILIIICLSAFIYLNINSLKTIPAGNAQFNRLVDLKSSSASTELSINRKWVLKNPENTKLLDNAIFTVSGDDALIQSIDNYLMIIKDLDNQIKINKEITLDQNNSFDISEILLNMEPGKYFTNVLSLSVDDVQLYQSSSVSFELSYPLYVTWTQDWEGWDVAEYNLNEMINISNKYQLPIVHLFNPIIYVENQYSVSQFGKTSPERAEYLTYWVKKRISVGDELGLHLHMFDDMIEEVGLEPRVDPISGAYSDTKTSSYTKEELDQIFLWSIEKFEEHGLPKPTSYRTGAWFSGPNVLQAANDAGILMDTTGRTGGHINPGNAGSSWLPWNLQPTTRPYRPSVWDINSWQGDRLSQLWEFPNNGADSYWFTASDLISRFQANFNGNALSKAQVLTYLSHPHWLKSVDSPKLEELFSFISNYMYRNDSGPVIFSTLINAYNNWDKSQINGD